MNNPQFATITEEDLERLDARAELDKLEPATDPVNAVFLRIGQAIAVTLTIVMTALVTVAVVLRYFFNSSLPIASEGPTYLFPWLITGGAIVAQAQMGHVAVDVFHSMLRGRNYRLATIGIWAFSTVVLAYVSYLAIYMVGPMAAQQTPIMGWPQLGSFGAFIVMVVCLTIQAAARTVYFIRHGVTRPEHDSDVSPVESSGTGVGHV